MAWPGSRCTRRSSAWTAGVTPTQVGPRARVTLGCCRQCVTTLHALITHPCLLVLHRRPAGTTDSVAHPYNNRGKYYAVVSVGRQTFASKKVRRAGERPTSRELSDAAPGAAAAAAAVGHAVAPSGGSASSRPRDDGVAVFRWDEGTDVVLQRSGATVAQVALYAAGRIDGALGDKLQASFFLTERALQLGSMYVSLRACRLAPVAGGGCGSSLQNACRPPAAPARLPRSAGARWTLQLTSMRRAASRQGRQQAGRPRQQQGWARRRRRRRTRPTCC